MKLHWMIWLAILLGIGFVIGVFVITVVHAGELPDPKVTPGARQQVTLKELCSGGGVVGQRLGHGLRNVAPATHRKAFALYGIKCGHQCGKLYEVDHLISLTIGGSNDITNLWPQAYAGKWNAHVKDKLEDRLHSLTCHNKLSLAAAQQCISSNWIACYKRLMRKP